MNALDAHKSGASVRKNYRKTTQVVRPCYEDESGAHSENNADVDIPGKRI